MNNVSTNREMQRSTFIESLYNSLRKQASKAIVDHKKFMIIANSYIQDGLDEKECVELLIIDGVSREAAESYASMASAKETTVEDEFNEYSFMFEDESGRVLSSYDIGKIVKAASDEDAWTNAEEILDVSVESHKIISVNRVS